MSGVMTDPVSRRQIRLDDAWVGAALFGPLYWWRQGAAVVAAVIVLTAGIAWPIVALFARPILSEHLSRLGWVDEERIVRYVVDSETDDSRVVLRVVLSEWGQTSPEEK